MENTNKKLLMYKIIFIILIIVAIVVASIIIKKRYDDQIYDKKNNDIVKLFYEAEKEQGKTENNENENNKTEIQLELEGHKVIGIIKIPSIDLEYPILEKTTSETMRIAITRFQGGEVNGYGNISLAGHNNYSGTMFGKNKNLKMGDKVYLTDLSGMTIKYEIYDIFVTNPDDTSILETKDETIREVTLITCKNGRSERLIIKAKETV